jgi:homocysteine S-methyltransferase
VLAVTSITILDGGMGKELRRIGAPFRQPEWSALALLEAPEFVAQAHRNFVEAGAEVIITNTYSVVPYHIGRQRFDDGGHQLATLAARMARAVADDAATPVKVAGSLPPLFGSYEPQNFDAEAAPELWRVLIEAQAPYVDLWVGETLSSTEECRTLIDTLARFGDVNKPRWMAFTLDDHLHNGKAVLRSGQPLSAVADLVAELNPIAEHDSKAGRRPPGAIQAVLFNCSQPESITPALEETAALLPTDGSIQLGAYANAFPAATIGDDEYAANERIVEPRTDLTPERYAEIAAEWADLGATIIGGCCDIYATHIAALTASLNR